MREPSILAACHQTGRAFIVAPHPDDEAVGAAVLMRRLRDEGVPVTLVFVTTGVPEASQIDASLSEAAGGVEDYKVTRAAEAARAAVLYRAQDVVRLSWPSRSILANMIAVDTVLDGLLADRGKGVVLSPPFEGGHPDHDALNCICSAVALRQDLPFWEYVGYHWRDASLHCQAFFPPTMTDCWLDLSEEEVSLKRTALDLYASQKVHALKHMRADIEGFRRPANHTHTLPAEQAYYEVWGSGISAAEVRAACERYDSIQRGRARR